MVYLGRVSALYFVHCTLLGCEVGTTLVVQVFLRGDLFRWAGWPASGFFFGMLSPGLCCTLTGFMVYLVSVRQEVIMTPKQLWKFIQERVDAPACFEIGKAVDTTMKRVEQIAFTRGAMVGGVLGVIVGIGISALRLYWSTL